MKKYIFMTSIICFSFLLGNGIGFAWTLESSHWKAGTTYSYSVGNDISTEGVSSITVADNHWNNPSWYNNAFTKKVTLANNFNGNTVKSFSKNSKNEIFKNSIGTGEALMLTSYWYSFGITSEADVLINTSYNWSNDPNNTPSNSWDVATVMLHEFGHVLGLDHSTTSGAIMRATFPDGFRQRSLGSDDIAGYNHINW